MRRCAGWVEVDNGRKVESKMRPFDTYIDVYKTEDHKLKEQLEGCDLPVSDNEYTEVSCIIDLDGIQVLFRLPGDLKRSEYCKVYFTSGVSLILNDGYERIVQAWKQK